MSFNFTILAGDIRNIGQDSVHNLLGHLRMGSLASSNHYGYLDFVTVFYEAPDMFHLKIVVVNADFGSELNLFNLHLFLMFSGFMLFFVEFIEKLTIIHNPADWRVGLWGYFH